MDVTLTRAQNRHRKEISMNAGDSKNQFFPSNVFIFKIFAFFQKIRKGLTQTLQNHLELIKNIFKQKS